MDALLTDQVMVVTGGASGIGRGIALRAANSGADIVVADVRETPREGGEPTVDRIRAETDASATVVDCDVSNQRDLEAAVDAAEAFGGLTSMVNNAGLLRKAPVLEMDPETLDAMIDVNVRGTFLGSQIAARRLVDGDGGTIINLSSVSGLTGTAGLAGYCATKGAVRLMTYALAAELGPEGIRVNTIHPGATETMQAVRDSEMIGSPEADRLREAIPLGRFGQPEDVADAAVYLASDMASYVNGESLLVDGGRINTA